MTVDDGLLSGPLDIEAPRRRGLESAPLLAEPGIRLRHRGSSTEGVLVRFVPDQLVRLRDDHGRDHDFRPRPAGFLHQGRPVTLTEPPPKVRAATRSYTPSGSVDLGPVPARVARASRLYVEGVHDAELIEKIWGDDLRIEGIVVEPMHGIDDLGELVRTFRPGPRRRLGILVDHLVEGSKEWRLAAPVSDSNVLICGHPYVDVWEAVKPGVVGLDAWPQVPPGRPWKEGLLEALGVREEPGVFWKRILGSVGTWTDLETPLITAVEQLIDFVAIPESSR